MNIAVYLSILLFVAMVFVDFLMVNTGQRDFIRNEMSKGYLLISILEKRMSNNFGFEYSGFSENLKNDFDDIIYKSGFLYAEIVDESGAYVYSFNKPDEFKKELEAVSKQVVRSRSRFASLIGDTWGVFWKQSRYLIISAPVFFKGDSVVCMSMVLKLDDYYQMLRKSQQIILLYILMNTVVFGLIGLYLISNLVIRPINRLVKRAEEYNEEDGFNFLYEKERNEFGLLSKSLNRMLKRISDDKEKLQVSLKSLEKANMEIKQAQNEIIRAEKLASVGRLSAGIAHEIGNPIGIVLGYLELLKKKELSGNEQKDYIHRAEDEINRINRIIRQLLDFSRTSAVISEDVHVHEVINEITNILEIQPLTANIEIKKSLHAQTDVVKADSSQLRQIMLNLMINAADAIHMSGNKLKGAIIITSEIVLKADRNNIDRNMLKVVFSDNGMGISRDDLNYIFDPFFTTKEPGKGTGLGLSVCFMIIEQMGGTIHAESEEGKGTTITLYFPLKKV